MTYTAGDSAEALNETGASSQISAFGSHGVVEANVTFNHWRKACARQI